MYSVCGTFFIHQSILYTRVEVQENFRQVAVELFVNPPQLMLFELEQV